MQANRRVIEIITIVGVVSTLLTIGYFLVYFFGAAHAQPNFMVRFTGDDQTTIRASGHKGYLYLGVSTTRNEEVILKSLEIECLTLEPIQFRAKMGSYLKIQDFTRSDK